MKRKDRNFRFAGRRNFLIGRLCYMHNSIRQIVRQEHVLLTNTERRELMKAELIISSITLNSNTRYQQLKQKRENEDRNRLAQMQK